METPIQIDLTLGDLSDALKNLDSYGNYVRSFDPSSGNIADEPGAGLETVLTLRLSVEGDLEPKWMLVSERTATAGTTRSLNWADRLKLAPTRLGAFNTQHLSWRRGSLLNRMSEERANASAALVQAGREARAAFGEQAKGQLKNTLKVVLDTANYLGISVGQEVKALLDANSVSFSGGTISLHDEDGIPLAGLGLGSTRLLVAGLQRMSAANASIVLIDELEYGLEPHRIIRLIDALGAKVTPPPLQVFMTTHSPVAVRELSGAQLHILRATGAGHIAHNVGTGDEIQGAIRLHPDALLACSIIVCEGASEVGFLRGLDQHRSGEGKKALAACGISLVDGNGKSTYRRAQAFQSLGYRTAVLCDRDLVLKPAEAAAFKAEEAAFAASGGTIFTWQEKMGLEDELFQSLSDHAVLSLLAHAIELRGEDFIEANIKSACGGKTTLAAIRVESQRAEGLTFETCEMLGKAAKSGKGWFKSVTVMETVTREIVGPDLANAARELTDVVDQVFAWSANV